MSRILKYPIPVGEGMNDIFHLKLHKNSKILSLQIQKEQIVLWVLSNEEEELKSRKFRIAGTGHYINENIKEFIGTIQLFNGSLVFHLFEVEL